MEETMEMTMEPAAEPGFEETVPMGPEPAPLPEQRTA